MHRDPSRPDVRPPLPRFLLLVGVVERRLSPTRHLQHDSDERWCSAEIQGGDLAAARPVR